MKLMNSLKIELFKIFFPGKYQEYARFFKAEELKVQLKINIVLAGGSWKTPFFQINWSVQCNRTSRVYPYLAMGSKSLFKFWFVLDFDTVNDRRLQIVRTKFPVFSAFPV